ncbi:UDP-glucosyltransferase UGT13248-like isoform X1 [Lolium rigidum]|uniref:UDP-glucosyltransferase UGT13248-like isoform X1 n=1 Tax=Lolium rigidum TaxID=89674 RepID=UPI001F5CDE55|nr:UDP-glucosyltransferase UGT13248-like isoform X1 [Lolium rigidum]
MESTPSADASSSGGGGGANVLLLPFPGAQGHTNPMLQFGRRLAYHGLRPTLVATRYVLSTTPPPGDPFRVAAISDGFDAGAGSSGGASSASIAQYMSRLEAVGSETLRELLLSEARAGRPVRVLVYDPLLAWATRVARAAGVPAAAFFSQPCAVNIVYAELCAGRLALPVTDGRALFARGALSVELEPEDVPPFVALPEQYPEFCNMSITQFEGLEDADDVLVNSFHDIEPKEAKYMESTWRAKMIGPAVPSFYLDDHRSPSNKFYGFNYLSGGESCMDWLEKQSANAVVFVSYGTFSEYEAPRLEELGNGLCSSGKPFLWVVRSSEAHKLSEKLKAKCEENGLIVSWCPQLEVLAHKSIGCFVTHCGWNSTLEAIACGVPLVAIPHWADQPTIAKYVQSVWGMGVRAQPGENGWIKRDEVNRCISEVMDGKRKDEYKRNAVKWMQKAKKAMQEGGSSDKNIARFAAKYSST